MELIQIQVKFITKQAKFAIPNVPISIPLNLKKKDLNEIINQILNPGKEYDDCISFDFLINGEILYESLEEHINEKNISTEEILNIEYVERMPAPSVGEWLQHDNWISSVEASQNLILTGSYDGLATMWTVKGEMLKVIEGHKQPVKSVTWLHEEPSNVKHFVTSSDDSTSKLWSWNTKNSSTNLSHICVSPELENSTRPRNIQCVAASMDKNMFATGSWDTTIQIWSSIPTTKEIIDDEDIVKKKKRKIDIESDSSLFRLPVRSLCGDSGHKNVVSSVDWMSDATVCSASWDHTIKTWDIHTAQNISTHSGSKVFFDISYSLHNKCIVTASADRHVRIYDHRISTGSMIKSTMTSHTAWVSCVDWSPTSEHHFISASYDCLVKLWDTRSPKAPLYDMGGHEDRILCCDWSQPNFMISGGSDKKLRIFQKNDYNDDDDDDDKFKMT